MSMIIIYFRLIRLHIGGWRWQRWQRDCQWPAKRRCHGWWNPPLVQPLKTKQKSAAAGEHQHTLSSSSSNWSSSSSSSSSYDHNHHKFKGMLVFRVGPQSVTFPKCNHLLVRMRRENQISLKSSRGRKHLKKASNEDGSLLGLQAPTHRLMLWAFFGAPA